MITLDLIAKEHFQGTKTLQPWSTKAVLKIRLLFFTGCQALTRLALRRPGQWRHVCGARLSMVQGAWVGELVEAQTARNP